MLLPSVTADITPLAHGHCGAGKLETAITDIRDDLASTLRDVQQVAECCERHVTKPYWFRCPACNFEWREWLRPSIIFVSLSFVTDTCPNCRKRHVPACAMGLNYNISAARGNDSEHHATIEKGLGIDALPERATSDGIAG
jgi:hypothetical protein